MKEALKSTCDKIAIVEVFKHAPAFRTLQVARNRKRLFENAFQSSVFKCALTKTSIL